MSWLFSRALVAEYSEDTCSDGAPSALSSGSLTQQAYLSPDKMTDFSRLSRFGMTFRPLTVDRGEALLTSYLAGFRARTLASQEKGPGSTASAAECGNTWHELSVRYDQNSSSWKTHRCLWDEDLPWSSVTLPRWGMTRNGVVFQHPTAERPISETGSGLWPTPTSSFGTKGGRVTPTKGREGGTLIEAVSARMYPSPGYNDYKSGKGYDHGDKKQTPQLRHISGGLLNPTWVEWLMGWPLGWTDLKPLATDRFREWQRQHGEA